MRQVRVIKEGRPFFHSAAQSSRRVGIALASIIL